MNEIRAFLLFIVLFPLTDANAVDVKTYRNDQLGFEISYLPNWARSSAPGNQPFFIKRTSNSEIGTISVDVANFSGKKDDFMREIRTGTEKFLLELRNRFPDAEILSQGDTYLGGFPAYHISTTYSLRNLDVEVHIAAVQVFCIKGNKIYLVNFETALPVFEKTYKEFQSIVATFNFR